MKRGYCRSVCFNNKPCEEWVCKKEHSNQAKTLLQILNIFKNSKLALKIWDARCHKNEAYTCWYVSFSDADSYIGKNGKNKLCIILHFDITSKDIRVYFRFRDYMPKDKLVGFRKEYIMFNENKDKIKQAIKAYLEKVRSHFESGSLPNFKNFKPSCSGEI